MKSDFSNFLSAIFLSDMSKKIEDLRKQQKTTSIEKGYLAEKIAVRHLATRVLSARDILILPASKSDEKHGKQQIQVSPGHQNKSK